jgi:hypothetical protein
MADKLIGKSDSIAEQVVDVFDNARTIVAAPAAVVEHRGSITRDGQRDAVGRQQPRFGRGRCVRPAGERQQL